MDVFENISTAGTSPLQEELEGDVSRKKAGRPTRPNMERAVVRLDKSLHAEIKKYAANAGVTKSAVIALAIKSFLERAGKKYKLVEV